MEPKEKEDFKLLMKTITAQIKLAEKEGYSMSDVSWGYQEGLIMSYNEAKLLLSKLKDLETQLSVLRKEAEQRSFGIVRWHENNMEDVVCINKEKAEEYVKKYNELAGSEKCYVDYDIFLPLTEA